MSRVRTGHGPMDWSQPDKGYPAAASGSAYMAGELVQAAGPSMTDKERARRRDKMRKYRERHQVDLEDYPRKPYENAPRCGAPLAIIGEPCARLAGHKWTHASRATLDARRSGRAA